MLRLSGDLISRLIKEGLAIPSKCTPPKTSPKWVSFKKKKARAKIVGPKVGTASCCDLCVIGHDGFPYCYDGVWTILDDYPKSGGPWSPAVSPNGQVTWVNAGAAGAFAGD